MYGMNEMDPFIPPGRRKQSNSAVSASAPSVPSVVNGEIASPGYQRNMTAIVKIAANATSCMYALVFILKFRGSIALLPF
jgi:hypothetical protein